jgi:putative Holliday junction resolvase
VKVIALDYGAARTGVAVSDATGTIARPLGIIERAASIDGLSELGALVREHEPELVVVGLPLTLRGERGAQALETEAFVDALRGIVDVPVETYDERFTTVIAASRATSRLRGRSDPPTGCVVPGCGGARGNRLHGR